MKKLTFTNDTKSIIITNYELPYVLKSFNLDTEIDNVTSKTVNQDGVHHINTNIGAGNAELSFVIVANNKNELESMKADIRQIFNHTSNIKCIYNNNINERIISLKIDSVPKFVEIDDLCCECSIDLLAPSPYWQDLSESRNDIAKWQKAFKFPLMIPQEGVPVGYREPSLIVNVFNKGDVKADLKIEFRAKGSLSKPSLLNVNTKEFIKINKDMVAGEVITITTGYGNKKVIKYLNGITENIFNHLDLESTFLYLYQGDNLFRYDCESGLDNLEVTIYFTPKYLGV